MKRWIVVFLCLTMTMCAGCGIKIEKKQEVKTEEMQEASDETYLVNRCQVDGINFYDVTLRESEGKRPAVFFLHGLTRGKEKMFPGAKKLADAGYTAVVPDCAGHGENASEETMNLYEMIKKTAENCDSILEYYEDSDTVDSSRFAIAGFSMGAMASLYYGAYGEKQPECIVSLFGTPVWESMFGGDIVYTLGSDGEFAHMEEEAEKQELMLSMMEASPDNEMEHLLRIPILMINGDSDKLIPITAVKSFEAKASLYPNQLECVVRNGRGHHATSSDLRKMILFLSRHLPVEEQMEE